MSETLRSIRNMLIAAIIGAAIASTIIFYTAIKHGDERFREAQATITAITDANRRLQADYQGLASTNRELTERLASRQRVINEIDKAVNGLASGLDDSAELIQQALDTISRIEYLLYH